MQLVFDLAVTVYDRPVELNIIITYLSHHLLNSEKQVYEIDHKKRKMKYTSTFHKTLKYPEIDHSYNKWKLNNDRYSDLYKELHLIEHTKVRSLLKKLNANFTNTIKSDDIKKYVKIARLILKKRIEK